MIVYFNITKISINQTQFITVKVITEILQNTEITFVDITHGKENYKISFIFVTINTGGIKTTFTAAKMDALVRTDRYGMSL